MSERGRVQALFARWVEARIEHEAGAGSAAGAEPTPEDLCRECPELLGDLRERIRIYQGLETTLAAPSPTLVGTTLGHYRIERKIGEGGMGEVYEALDETLQRRVALKMLPPWMAASEERCRRFAREARAVAALNHPHIVTLYSMEESDGVHFLTMELVEGETLAEILSRGALSLERFYAVAVPLAEALSAAHERGITHRDLKPGNVMVAAGDGVKLLDFGLAKDQATHRRVSGARAAVRAGRARASAPGAVLGTAGYMSPEQARGEAVDPQTDIWAFGCVAYEMLTGGPAFRGETTDEVLALVVRSDPDWTRLPATVPAAVRRLLQRCLERDRARRLRDVADVRIELEQLARDGASGRPETAASAVDFGPHNLPASRNSFIGREETQREIRELLETSRLITLTGVGGSGKTRLALEVARGLVATFRDGVRLVDLAPACEDEVPAVAASGTGVPGFCDESPAIGPLGPPERHIVRHVADRRLLVVLDNCEHVREAVARFVDRLLDACPRLVILATSREPLEVPGETVRQVAPLGTPEVESTLDEALATESVRLFVDRAAAARTGFALTSRNLEAVVRICRRLDGIPLALELAAARMRHLAPGQIAERLEESFDLLRDRGSVVDDRHRTLTATMDWSYSLLSPAEQALLRWVSVFVGGFGLEALEAVCGAGGLELVDLLALLGSLVDRSLVVADDTGSEVRYRLLETVRQYALEKLRDAGEEELLRTRHRDFFVSWVKADQSLVLSRSLYSLDHRLAAIGLELPNLVAAIDWSLERGEAEPSMTLTGWGYWHFREAGRDEEIASRVERALALAGEGASEAKVVATFARGLVLYYKGRFAEAYDYHQRALRGARSGALDHIIASVLVCTGFVAQTSGQGRPLELYEAAIDLATKLGDRRVLAQAKHFLGTYLYTKGALGRAARLLEEAAQMTAGTYLGAWVSSSRLLVALVAGDQQSIPTWCERTAAVPVVETQNLHSFLVVNTGFAIALAKAACGARREAETVLEEYLDLMRSENWMGADAAGLSAFAGVAALSGEYERASRLLGAACTAMAVNRMVWRIGPLIVEFRRRVEEHLDPETAGRTHDEGRAMSIEEAIAYAESGLERGGTKAE